jgi:hypothetical protein
MTKKTGNPVGRPKAVTRAVGRPKGEAAVMKDFRNRLLNSPKSPKVLDAIFNAALDDDHKHQAAAWKLIVDRIAPQATFTDESGKKTGGIEINITGLSASVKPIDESIDAEFVEVADE